jgi:hypothetical protein
MAADDNRPVGLAGLIVACLDSPERRRHEDRLLEIYHSVDRARRRRLPPVGCPHDTARAASPASSGNADCSQPTRRLTFQDLVRGRRTRR